MTKKEKKELEQKAKKAKKVAKKAKKAAKKLGRKRVIILLTIVVCVLLGFFGFSYYKYKDPFYFFKPHKQESVELEGNVFEHQLYGKNMNKKDSFTVNGLTFNFPLNDYDEYDKGIKLGSTSKPILESNPFYIETTFPSSAIVDSFSFVLANNEKGNTTYTVTIGDKTIKNSNNSTDETNIVLNNLKINANKLRLELFNTKGCYLKSLKINFDNPSFGVGKDVVTFDAVVPGKNNIPSTFYKVISKEEYYKNIDLSQTGEHLRKLLNERINKDTHYNSYKDAQTMLIYTDERVDKKGVLYSVYDSNEIKPEWSSNVWNREHIWPCSKMEREGYYNEQNKDYRPVESSKDYRSDLHNLRVLTRSLNIERNNSYYAEKDGNDMFFPNRSEDDFRGDVARIIFYMNLRYPDLKLGEEPTENGTTMGKLSLLKKWANEDPVSDFEIQRNNRIYEYQGNRNPFIDYPSIVNSLYA